MNIQIFHQDRGMGLVSNIFLLICQKCLCIIALHLQEHEHFLNQLLIFLHEVFSQQRHLWSPTSFDFSSCAYSVPPFIISAGNHHKSKSKCCFDCMFSVSESLDCSVHRLNATYLLSGHDNAVDVSAAGQKSLRSDGCFLSLTFFARAVCPFDVGRSARAHKRHGKVLIPREMQHSVEPMWEIGKCINMTVAWIVHIRDDQRRVRPKSN